MTQEGRWYVLSLQPTLPETNIATENDGWNMISGEMLVLGSVNGGN